MEDIRVCKRCRKMFQYYGYDLCKACIIEVDDAFVIVREYLYDHSDATIQDIVKDTDVEERDVLRLLRDGRISLERGGEGGSGIGCERCGRSIMSGRLCESCAGMFEKALENMTPAALEQKSVSSGTGKAKKDDTVLGQIKR